MFLVIFFIPLDILKREAGSWQFVDVGSGHSLKTVEKTSEIFELSEQDFKTFLKVSANSALAPKKLFLANHGSVDRRRAPAFPVG
jgi:hypothetical protein